MLKGLMTQLGHSSVRAAMIYPARDQGPDKAIAKALGTFFREARNATGQKASRFSLKVLCG